MQDIIEEILVNCDKKKNKKQEPTNIDKRWVTQCKKKVNQIKNIGQKVKNISDQIVGTKKKNGLLNSKSLYKPKHHNKPEQEIQNKCKEIYGNINKQPSSKTSTEKYTCSDLTFEGDILLPLEDINVGIGAKAILKKLKTVQKPGKRELRSSCRQLLIALIKKLFQRYSLKSFYLFNYPKFPSKN